MPLPASHGSILGRSLAGSSLATPIRLAVLALAVAATAAAAQVTAPLPFTNVPFVLTPLAVLLSGAALGSRAGAASQVLYVALGAAGLQVFAPSLTLPPGIMRLAGPTGGYLMAYPVAAFVTGWLAERGWDRRYWTSFAAMVAGLLVIYAGGVSWNAWLLGSFQLALLTSVVPFVVPDVLKAAAAAWILPVVWRLVRD
jgi:biotin transport system substrate-specific component